MRRPPRYLSAHGPVSARTAAGPGRTPLARLAPNHAARHACRTQLGPGLRRQLRPVGTSRRTLRRWLGIAALLVAVGGLPLAAMLGAWTWLIAGAVMVGAWLAYRFKPRDVQHAPELGLTARELEAFDRRLADIAGDLTDAQRTTLRDIKVLIARLLTDRGTEDGPFAIENQVYATACVRRHVPELLAAYSAVPAALRSAPDVATNATASDLLTVRLARVHAELGTRWLHAARRATRALAP
jgi:hypothetical protein